ncbi:MAG: hypothetical protein HKN02_06775 [Rhodobacteraceae bacterium]|nr:hypothetical protein [Paracoccaceae bacterium]
MSDKNEPATPEELLRVDSYFQKTRLLLSLIGLLGAFLLLVIFAALVGSGFDPASNDPLFAVLVAIGLVLPILGFGWLLWKRPKVLVVSQDGLHVPFAFKRPLGWQDIHRIRRSRTGRSLQGRRDWLIVEPSPGVLPPLRLPTWRKLDLWFQKHHGIRIPLHGIEGNPDDVVASIERFRPVFEES